MRSLPWIMLSGLLCAQVLAAPVVFWASDPVGPDETVLAMGGGFGNAPTIEVGRLPDDVKATGMANLWSLVEKPAMVKPLQVSDHSLKFVLPAGLKPGLFAFRVKSGAEVSSVRVLNAPDVWWLQGDLGENASPGGWVRLFGKCLDSGGAVQASLEGPEKVSLKATSTESWSAQVTLPETLAPGEYQVKLHNGFGGAAGWMAAGSLTVATPEPSKTEVFNVRDFGTDTDKAVRAALAKVEENGGGVVYFPRGRYQIKGELLLPPGAILRGEAMELVSLYWPDMDEPPRDTIHGPRFGLENLSIYMQNHGNVISDEAGSNGTFIRKVRIRANCYFMIEDIGKEFRGRQGPTSHRKAGHAIMLRGRNFEVTDCDIYTSNIALYVYFAKCGVIARNKLLYGGRGYSIENTEKLIFEDNLIAGNNLLAIGNDIHTFWTNYCRHIYYARNHIQQMFGADREMMTLDAAGGAYFGKIAQASGTHLTLAADPVFKDYAPPGRHTDWTGAACLILDGTGAGQWRWVTKNEGREWDVDRAWDIAPDDASLISIVPHRGRNLYIGNTFTDGGAFQLYGAAFDTIVAGNKGARMDGFFAWGLNPHGWGWQPCFNCQFLDNEILEGNGYGHRASFFGAFTGNNNETYPGPLARAIVFRRNVCHNNARFRLGGTLDGALVEHCTVRHNDLGISVAKSTANVLLRDNKFEDVATPYEGDGLDQALILPSR